MTVEEKIQKKIQEALDARNILQFYGEFPGQILTKNLEDLEGEELEAASLEPHYAKIGKEMNKQNKYHARIKIEEFVKRTDDPYGYSVDSEKIKKTVKALVKKYQQKLNFNDERDICNVVGTRASNSDIRSFNTKPLSDAEILDLRSKLNVYGRGGGRRNKRRTGKKAKGKKRNSRTIKRNKK